MKKQKRNFRNLMLCSIFLICCTHASLGQKVNISAGMGSPELLNVGLRYQLDQAQIGLSFGSMPVKDESMVSFAGDVYYHFAGSSVLSNRRPWYGRGGLTWLRYETDNLIDKHLYLNTRLGRDLYFSEKFGVNIDTGLSFELHRERARKVPPGMWSFQLDFPVLPSVGIGFFYRI